MAAVVDASAMSSEDRWGTVHPWASASWWSRVSIGWVADLLRLGNERPLEFEDLMPLRPEDNGEVLYNVFMEQWPNCTGKYRLVWALWNSFGWTFSQAGFLKLLADK